jgi:hypothetical protein
VSVTAFVGPTALWTPRQQQQQQHSFHSIANRPTTAGSLAPQQQQQHYGNMKTARRMIGSLLDLLGGGSAEMVSPEKALPGRQQKMPNIEGLRHYVLGNKLEEVPQGYKVAVFANGCFCELLLFLCI